MTSSMIPGRRVCDNNFVLRVEGTEGNQSFQTKSCLDTLSPKPLSVKALAIGPSVLPFWDYLVGF